MIDDEDEKEVLTKLTQQIIEKKDNDWNKRIDDLCARKLNDLKLRDLNNAMNLFIERFKAYEQLAVNPEVLANVIMRQRDEAEKISKEKFNSLFFTGIVLKYFFYSTLVLLVLTIFWFFLFYLIIDDLPTFQTRKQIEDSLSYEFCEKNKALSVNSDGKAYCYFLVENPNKLKPKTKTQEGVKP